MQDENLISFFNTNDSIEVFDFDYQNKFIKVFIEDKLFSERIMDILDVNYFEEFQKLLISRIVEFIEKFGQVYDYGDIKSYINDKENGITKDYMISLLENIQGITSINIKRVKDRADEYFQKQNMRNALIDSVKNWQNCRYEDIANTIKEAMKKGQPKGSEINYFRDVDSRMQKEYREPITIMKGLDKFFSGGLAGGELGIVMAPTGGGKSMALVRFACEALLAGKKVIYYTLELSGTRVAHRFDSCLSGVKLKNTWDFPDVIKERLDDISKAGGELIIEYFATQTATINTIVSSIKNLERNSGFIPDIVFIDYADLMKPTVRFTEKRDTLTHIYECIRGSAIDLNIPIWTATQTNRSPLNSESGIFGMGAMGESMGKANTADVVIGIGRPDSLKEVSMAMINIIKNRNGEDGFSLECYFDTSRVYIELAAPNKSELSLIAGIPIKSNKKGPVIYENTIPPERGGFDENINSILIQKRQVETQA